MHSPLWKDEYAGCCTSPLFKYLSDSMTHVKKNLLDIPITIINNLVQYALKKQIKIVYNRDGYPKKSYQESTQKKHGRKTK